MGCYISSDPAEMEDNWPTCHHCRRAERLYCISFPGQGRPRPSGIRGWSPAFGAEDRLEQVTVDLEGGLCTAGRSGAMALEPEMTQALCQRSGGTSQVYGGGVQPAPPRSGGGEGCGAGSPKRLRRGLSQLVERDCPVGGGERQENRVLESYVATAENMFTDPMDQILFPSGRREGHCIKTGGKRALVLGALLLLAGSGCRGQGKHESPPADRRGSL